MYKIALPAALLILAAGVFGAFPIRGESPAPAPKAPREARLLFVGDMFFDRSIRQAAEREGFAYLFSCAQKTLRSYDAVIGNLEGPITDNPSVSMGSEVGSADNYTFTFAPETADALAANNITIVNLGNNHILNMGEEGLVSTKRYLMAARVDYFGGIAGDSPVFRTSIGGTDLSFVNFNEFGGEPPQEVVRKIEAERDDGRMVIVYAHWGDEYVEPPARVKQWAETFAQAGARLIIGSHPHVVQERAKIGNTEVFYSLGNFLFDQYWNDSVRTGLALEADFRDGTLVATKELRTAMYANRQVCFGGDTPQDGGEAH